ncbi:MAG: fimbrillin family protein [Rikenellaceae bacterium]
MKFLLYIGVAFAAIGCAKDADVDVAPLGDNVLTITSNIATRAEKSQWADKDAIGVYMTSVDLGDEGANVEYTTTGSGSFTSEDPLYMPSSGTVDIFAYYPYVKDVSIKAYDIKSVDQVDLLSVTQQNVSSSAVELIFNHLLSKMSLVIEAGDGLDTEDLKGLSVTLSGISTTATFDLTSDVATTTNSAAQLTLTTTTDGTSSSAIIIPQDDFSTVTLSFTTDKYGTFSAPLSTTEFKVGVEYTYTATLDRDGVEIASSNITPWSSDGEILGTANIVDIEYKSDGKYYINSAKGLAAFRDLVNGAVNTTATSAGVTFSTDAKLDIDGVLTREIDLVDICSEASNTSWTPIGFSSNATGSWVNYYYTGTFDGGGYKVKNLYINSGASQQALIRYLGDGGMVYNLGVSGSVTAANSTEELFQTAGLVANNYGYVVNCYSEVNVVGETNVGGIAGYNEGYVVNCYNHGSVIGVDNNVGGIVGQNETGGYVGYCYSTGYIDLEATDDRRIGGVVGYNHSTTADAPTIKGSFCIESENTDYSIGQVETNASSGGLDGNVCTEDYLTSASFVTTLNNGAATYNSSTTYSTAAGEYATYNLDSKLVYACSWSAVSGGYPTLDFYQTPQTVVLDISFNSQSYNINNEDGLRAFAALVNGEAMPDGVVTSGDDIYFQFGTPYPTIDGRLTDNIDLSAICSSGNGSWTPIGNSSTTPYSGTFDGCGKTISKLYISSALSNQALFGYVTAEGVVNNLTVEGSVYSHDGSSAVSNIGGVAAYNSGLIINSCNKVAVSGNSKVGGVVGCNAGTVANCCNIGAITGLASDGTTTGGTTVGGDMVGGLVGENTTAGSVYYVYNAGSINGGVENDGTNIGSVIGYNYNTASGCFTLDGATYDNRIFGEKSDTYSDFTKSKEALQGADFVITLNKNATTYNGKDGISTDASGWVAVDNDYPAHVYGSTPNSDGGYTLPE